MPLKEVPGTHCEMCHKPVQEGFYNHFCRMFHGHEFLCGNCQEIVNTQIGPRLLVYLNESGGGCLFEEIKWAEIRLGIKLEIVKRPV